MASGFYNNARMGYIFSPADGNLAMPASRDKNRNGGIDPNEADIPATADQILFHAGATHTPMSAGCQTMPPLENKRFYGAIKSVNATAFTYLSICRPNDQFGEYIF